MGGSSRGVPAALRPGLTDTDPTAYFWLIADQLWRSKHSSDVIPVCCTTAKAQCC